MRDYYNDGFQQGYGRPNDNYDNDYPRSDGDRYSYRCGVEDGERRRRVSDELDRELYGSQY